MFNLLKEYYPDFFTLNDIKQSVIIGWITPVEYQSITGTDYVPS